VTAPHVTELRVRYGETDQMGVVYHAEYLVYCEIGRTELIRTLGMTYAEMEARGCLLAVSEATLRFHAPARYDDPLRIETRLADLRSRAVTFDYAIHHAESGARLVSARTSLVSIDKSGRPVTIPLDIRTLLGAALAKAN
jgi:acyl-CoA thioester hydrolase